jgi:hypothetical protein
LGFAEFKQFYDERNPFPFVDQMRTKYLSETNTVWADEALEHLSTYDEDGQPKYDILGPEADVKDTVRQFTY